MKFQMVCDMEFEAEDIDDAFEKLSEHFLKLQQGYDSTLLCKGAIGIKPVSIQQDNNNNNKGNL